MKHKLIKACPVAFGETDVKSRIKVVETPNALKGNEFLNKHPELRGADLEWALTNPEIKTIIC